MVGFILWRIFIQLLLYNTYSLIIYKIYIIKSLQYNFLKVLNQKDRKEYWNNTVKILTDSLSWLDFDISCKKSNCYWGKVTSSEDGVGAHKSNKVSGLPS